MDEPALRNPRSAHCEVARARRVRHPDTGRPGRSRRLGDEAGDARCVEASGATVRGCLSAMAKEGPASGGEPCSRWHVWISGRAPETGGRHPRAPDDDRPPEQIRFLPFDATFGRLVLQFAWSAEGPDLVSAAEVDRRLVQIWPLQGSVHWPTKEITAPCGAQLRASSSRLAAPSVLRPYVGAIGSEAVRAARVLVSVHAPIHRLSFKGLLARVAAIDVDRTIAS